MNTQGNIEKENQSRGHHNARFQSVLQSCDHQDGVSLAQNSHIDQGNGTENSEMGTELYGQLIFDKAGKTLHWKKDSLFNKWCWENWTSTVRRMKLDHSLSPYTKTNSKWMKDLIVQQESIKILEKNTDNTLFELDCSNFLQDTSIKARETKAKMNYWDFIKIKSFCTAKETVNKTKRQPTEWEEIFVNNISDKGLVSKIYKELIKLNTQKTQNTQSRNGQKT